jgi:hypothetical protein
MECIFNIICALQSMFIMIMHACNFLKFYEFIYLFIEKKLYVKINEMIMYQ